MFRTKQAMVLESTSSMSSRKTSAGAQPVAVEAPTATGEKTSRTPTSPKQKGTKTGNTAAGAGAAAATNQARKASKGVHAAILEDEFYSVLHAHYYPSFVQAFLSKLVCLSSWNLSKKSLFEHIGDLYSRVTITRGFKFHLADVIINFNC